MSQIHCFQRNLLIISKVKRSPYTGLSELLAHIRDEFEFRGIENVGVSRRTVLRDIQNIATDFGIDIAYSRERQGYYITEGGIRSDIDRLLDELDMLSALHQETSIPDFIFAEKHRPLGTQHLYPLISAIKNSRRVTFSYCKFQNASVSERHLEPYALKECRGRWYVIARTVGQTDMKSYGLDRINQLVVSDETFNKDSSVDISEKFKYSYGIYSSDEYPVENVVLSFSAEDGSYLKSLPLHHSQEIIQDDKEAFVIRLKLKVTLDFVMELMSRSWSLKVIEPASLREQICEIYHSALQRMSPKPQAPSPKPLKHSRQS
ncbi:MAG: WYL domain-containing protein [Tannerellaceae bacterium]|jgi:predicted DNA-binding transcriptional regulator YafY|nr:WYL domain-containing protein [Tannerellaceae bacterium]